MDNGVCLERIRGEKIEIIGYPVAELKSRCGAPGLVAGLQDSFDQKYGVNRGVNRDGINIPEVGFERCRQRAPLYHEIP